VEKSSMVKLATRRLPNQQTERDSFKLTSTSLPNQQAEKPSMVKLATRRLPNQQAEERDLFKLANTSLPNQQVEQPSMVKLANRRLVGKGKGEGAEEDASAHPWRRSPSCRPLSHEKVAATWLPRLRPGQILEELAAPGTPTRLACPSRDLKTPSRSEAGSSLLQPLLPLQPSAALANGTQPAPGL
jgi:hypothetical protein